MNLLASYTKLSKFDKASVWLIAALTVLGAFSNFARVRADNVIDFTLMTLLGVIMWSGVAVVVLFSLFMLRVSVRYFGFSLGWGGTISILFVLGFSIFKMLQNQIQLPPQATLFTFSLIGACVEELVFRAIAINTFIKLFDGLSGKTFWAIAASGSMWVAVHIPSKEPSMLIGLFITSLILGTIYYKSKSLLIPAWVHVVANTSWFGGVVTLLVYLLMLIFDWLVLKRIFSRGVIPVQSMPTG